MNPAEKHVVANDEGSPQPAAKIVKHKAPSEKEQEDKAVTIEKPSLHDEIIAPESEVNEAKESKENKESKKDSAIDASVNITKDAAVELDAKDGHTTDLSTIKFGNLSVVTSQERDLAMISVLNDAPTYQQQITFIQALSSTIVNLEEFNIIRGTERPELLTGTPGRDWILGLQGNDSLAGLGGNDKLDGGPGADLMFGGLGDDSYYVDNISDFVGEFLGEGIDTVFTSVNYTLPGNVEKLTSLGPAGLFTFLTGNGLNNTIIGSVGMDIINGGAGVDTMIGGLGDDQYYFQNVGDVIQEKVNEGFDTVYTNFSYVLPENVEILIGTAPNITLTGNSLDNIINAVQSNTTLIGGLGNDLYVVRFANDTVIENPGEGNDEIQTDISLVLPDNVERLYGFGTDPISLTGNNLGNFIINNQASNVITGGLGTDAFAFDVINTGNDIVTDYSLAVSEILSFNHVADTDGIPGRSVQDLKNMVTSVEHPNGGADTKFNFGAGQSVTLVGVVVSNVDDPLIASNIQVYG